jgi:hypothetical protein
MMTCAQTDILFFRWVILTERKWVSSRERRRLFVGLASEDLSILRVSTRRMQGGHDVPEAKLRSRFPRTQKAIGIASEVADLTLMFDNSRSIESAFALVRAQRKKEILYDCRDVNFKQDPDLARIAGIWLSKVAPQASA